MRTLKTLALLPLVALIACSDSGSAKRTGSPSPDAPVTPQWISTEGADRVSGDVTPTSLRVLHLPEHQPDAMIQGADPAPSRTVFQAEKPTIPQNSREFRVVIPPGSNQTTAFPIDAPQGARVIVSVAERGKPGAARLNNIHLRELDGNRVLDLARDSQSTLPVRPRAKPGVVDASPEVEAAPLVKQIDTTTPVFEEHDLKELVKVDPALAQLAVPRRMLSVDVETKPGFVYVELPKAALDVGVMIEVQQPKSNIKVHAEADQPFHVFGDTVEIDLHVTDAGAVVSEVEFNGFLETPSGQRIDGLTIKPSRDGHYVATVPIVSAEAKHVGVWTFRGTAKGKTSEGIAFQRDVEATFGYSVTFARMAQVFTPVVNHGEDGKIDAVQVDVEIDSVQAARLGLHGTLVYKDSEGVEHPVAVAQTGQDVSEGTNVMTLVFSSGALSIAKVDGPFFLRDLALVSHSNASTQHRIGLGLLQQTPAIKASDLRPMAEIPASVQESIDLGSL